jgi:hypothetical protein
MRHFTAVAGKATAFAKLFNATFAAGIDGQGQAGFRVDLTAPAGPSTAGGKQALQHILLVPRDGAPAMVMGGVNQADMTAEIRTFRHLAEVHATRFRGARVPVDVNVYRELTRTMHAFFVAQQMSVVMVDVSEAPRSSMPPPAPVSPSQTPWIIAGVAVAFAMGLGLLAVLLLVGRGPTAAPASAPSSSAPASASAR